MGKPFTRMQIETAHTPQNMLGLEDDWPVLPIHCFFSGLVGGGARGVKWPTVVKFMEFRQGWVSASFFLDWFGDIMIALTRYSLKIC